MPSYIQEAPPQVQAERGQTGAGQTIPLSKNYSSLGKSCLLENGEYEDENYYGLVCR